MICPSNMFGGSSSSSGILKAFGIIIVTYPEGFNCVCSKGSYVLRAKDTSGLVAFSVKEPGEYTITATDGSESKSEIVEIATQYETKRVSLTFGSLIFQSGSGFLVPYKEVRTSSNHGTITVSDESIYLKSHYDGNLYLVAVATQNVVDVTDYSAMVVDIYSASVSTARFNPYISLSSDTSTITQLMDTAVAELNCKGTAKGRYTARMDISSVSGSYYPTVSMHAANNYYTYVYNWYFE